MCPSCESADSLGGKNGHANGTPNGVNGISGVNENHGPNDGGYPVSFQFEPAGMCFYFQILRLLIAFYPMAEKLHANFS